MADFKLEREILKTGHKKIAGLDEVGRGALFGPVVAAAVIFQSSLVEEEANGYLLEINDSKLLSPLKRKRLAKAILTDAYSVGIGMATNLEIDQKNIYKASLEAMARAIINLPVTPDFLLVDGFCLNNVHYSQLKVPQGDKKSISIAAASIIAKVLRDEMMTHLDEIYEGYSLTKNKGYGTKEHYRSLEERGPTLFHRLTFNLGGSGR